MRARETAAAPQLRLRGGAADSAGGDAGEPGDVALQAPALSSVLSPALSEGRDPPVTPPATRRRVCFDEANLEANRQDVEVKRVKWTHKDTHARIMRARTHNAA